MLGECFPVCSSFQSDVCNLSQISEACSETSQISMMNLFYEKSQQLLAVNHFCKKLFF